MKNAELQSRIASARIALLLSRAEIRASENTDVSKKLAKRYTLLAQRISTHYKVPVPKKFRHRICKNCGNFLVPGVNCSARLASSHGYVVYVCECGEENHVFYKKKR